MSEQDEIMVGWRPGDPLPWVVLVCPNCGRELDTPAMARERSCLCGAVLRRLGWVAYKSAESRDLVLGGEESAE